MTDDTSLSALLEARLILRDVTPLKRDCGRVCGAACCQPDETGRGGMLLFPGEDALYKDKQGFTVTADDPAFPGVPVLTCQGECDREDRPLACRLFPLLPRERGGAVQAVRDRRGFCVCPLLPDGLAAFDPAFVSAVIRAGECLYRVPEHRRFLDTLHAGLDAFRTILTG